VEWGKLNEMDCETGLNGGLEHELDPFDGRYPNLFGYGRAIEGACGCIRACMIHLEERRKIKNLFQNKFRTEKPWFIDHSKPYELTPYLIEHYQKTGMIEDYGEQIRYDAEQNFKTAKVATADKGQTD
jgi:hypothetical protein